MHANRIAVLRDKPAKSFLRDDRDVQERDQHDCEVAVVAGKRPPATDRRLKPYPQKLPGRLEAFDGEEQLELLIFRPERKLPGLQPRPDALGVAAAQAEH